MRRRLDGSTDRSALRDIVERLRTRTGTSCVEQRLVDRPQRNVFDQERATGRNRVLD